MLRKVKRLENDFWVDVDLMRLKKGDFFKLFDGGPIPYEDGSETYLAIGDPYIPEETGVGTIMCVRRNI